MHDTSPSHASDPDEADATTRLSWGRVFAYCVANVGYCMFYALNNGVLPLWLERFTRNAALINLLSGSHGFEGIVLQPLAGSFSDRLRTRWGRRRPLILLFTPISCLFLFLTPFAAHLPEPARLTGIIACIIVFTMTFNLAYDPYQALLADATSPSQRGEVTAIWFLANAVGQVLIVMKLTKHDVPLDEKFVLVAVSMLLLSLVAVAFTPEAPTPNPSLKGRESEDFIPHPNPLLGKEREKEPTPNPSLKGRETEDFIPHPNPLLGKEREKEPTPNPSLKGRETEDFIPHPNPLLGKEREPDEETGGDAHPTRGREPWRGIAETMRGLSTLKQARYFLLMNLIYGAGVDAVVPNITRFTENITHCGDRGAQSAFMTVMLTTGIAVIPCGWLADRLGFKRVLIAGVSLVGVAALLGMWVHTLPQVYAVMVVAGLGTACQNASAYPLLTRIVPAAEIGFYTGVQTAAASIASPVALVVTGVLTMHADYRVIFVVCAVCVILSMAFLLPIRMERARAEVAEREAP